MLTQPHPSLVAPGTRRRRFLKAMAAGAALSGAGAIPDAQAEPPPEIRRVRIQTDPIVCLAPQFLAKTLLELEGFESVEYVDLKGSLGPKALSNGVVDFTIWDAASSLTAFEANPGFVFLAGLHAGCWELFGNDRVRVIRDLEGKRIAIRGFGDTDHVLISSMLAYVGIDPSAAVQWVQVPTYREGRARFAAGEVDAVLCSPPGPQELRARRVGHVIVNSTVDRPWAHYYCCMIEASRTFATQYPSATKRVVRAFLKAADFCADAPAEAARLLVAEKRTGDARAAEEVLRSLPYRAWRDVLPEDTLRFFALRLHDVGMLRMTPNEILVQSTDWRILNALRQELRG